MFYVNPSARPPAGSAPAREPRLCDGPSRTHFPFAGLLFFFALFVGRWFAPALSAAVFDSAVLLADVDQAVTQAFVGKEAKEITPDQLRWVLGFGGERRPWSATPAKNDGKEPVHFRLARNKPVTIGTILGRVGELRTVKAD